MLHDANLSLKTDEVAQKDLSKPACPGDPEMLWVQENCLLRPKQRWIPLPSPLPTAEDREQGLAHEKSVD